jgi:glycosyltransferase involved in cell wall biosynthesis
MGTRPGPVVHVTTVHARDDIRIFRKECVSLARAGHRVVQIVGDGRGDAVVDGVQILDIGAAPAGRMARMRRQPARALEAIEALRPSLVHLHDPELLPIGARLAAQGCPVVYDAHEDVPRQILTKQWIPRLLRPLVAALFEAYEDRRVRQLAAVVAATPHIAARFARIAPRAVVVANYPLVDELAPDPCPPPRERSVCYVGGLMRTRGAFEMVRAVALLPGVALHLAGSFEDATLEAALRAEPGWRQVVWHGHLDRSRVRALLARCGAGLVTLLPLPSYRDALPIKLFEYMSAALPVVASDFPLWRGIVAGSGCGLCVDPASPASIAAGLETILDDAERATAMGRAGRQAVLSEYQWSTQQARLLDLYAELLA